MPLAATAVQRQREIREKEEENSNRSKPLVTLARLETGTASISPEMPGSHPRGETRGRAWRAWVLAWCLAMPPEKPRQYSGQVLGAFSVLLLLSEIIAPWSRWCSRATLSQRRMIDLHATHCRPYHYRHYQHRKYEDRLQDSSLATYRKITFPPFIIFLLFTSGGAFSRCLAAPLGRSSSVLGSPPSSTVPGLGISGRAVRKVTCQEPFAIGLLRTLSFKNHILEMVGRDVPLTARCLVSERKCALRENCCKHGVRHHRGTSLFLDLAKT